METDILCSYEHKPLENNISNMDIGITNEESISSVNKSCEDSMESTGSAVEQGKEQIEVESDEECEEEEKLLLSPVHSDKAYDSEEGLLSPPLTRDLDESDNEVEKDKEQTEEVVENKMEDKKNETEAQKVVEEKINDNKEVEKKDNSGKSENCEQTENDNKNKRKKKVKGSKETKKEKSKSVEKEGTENKIADNKVDEDKEKIEGGNTELGCTKNSDEDKTSDENIVKENEKSDVKNNKNKEEAEEVENKDKVGNVKAIDKEEVDKNDEGTNKREQIEEKQDKENNQGINKEEMNESSKKEGENDESKDKQEKNEDSNRGKMDNENKDEQEKSKDINEGKEDNENKDKQLNDEIICKEDIMCVDDDSNKGSLLKETLTKPYNEEGDAENEPEMDMDEDFDPSLLCPELSMEVDEAPVITNHDATPASESDGSKSPLRLYDPIFSTFVDEMTGAEVDFNLTTEELELKAKTYGPENPVQFTRIHCTACNVHLGSAVDGQGNRFVHPLLKVLICQKCYHFYTSGEFEKDEDGSELYCRWCGQGGQVLCCSNCEMVFCKRCIRINFDRKKLSDIQKSDDWLCFRCNPSQLIHLRIHCAEFMEYVQGELRRASTSENSDTFLNTDYCQCCLPQKKKSIEPISSQPKKRKRFCEEDDPDYDPSREKDDVPPVLPPQPTPQKTIIMSQPKITPNAMVNRPIILRTTTPQYKPRTPMATTAARLQQSGVRLVQLAANTVVANNVRTPSFRQLAPNTTMKHEWFDKTVRAAARVNSNLSYTLTQLNKAQAVATSVEGLAIVHNKLQEILSSSINSLIQIRKNLRTEFIAGIKNIRFTPKTTTTQSTPSTSKDDDDVIFIPSETNPPPLVAVNSKPSTTFNHGLRLSPSVSLIKKVSPTVTPNTKLIINSTKSVSVAKKSTSAVDENIKPRGFLRVKSFSALQNVPSECITIPDDPVEEERKKADDNDEVVEVVEKDPLDVGTQSNGVTNGGEKNPEIKTEPEVKKEKTTEIVIRGKKIKKISLRPAKIVIQRSDKIDALAKSKIEKINGEA